MKEQFLAFTFAGEYYISLYKIKGDKVKAYDMALHAISAWHEDDDIPRSYSISEYVEWIWFENDIDYERVDCDVFGLNDSYYLDCEIVKEANSNELHKSCW